MTKAHSILAFNQSQYLASVVVDVRVTWINLCRHVEILYREHWLLLLHVHASTLNQSVGS